MSKPIADTYRLVHDLALRKGKYSTRHLLELLDDAESEAASFIDDISQLKRALTDCRSAMESGTDDELMSQLLYVKLSVMGIATTFDNLAGEIRLLYARDSTRMVVDQDTIELPVYRGSDSKQRNAEFRRVLAGKVVEAAGPTGLRFGDDWDLELLGERQLSGSEECVDEGEFCLAGAVLLSFVAEDDREVLTFDNGCTLTVPVGRPDPYPESMMLHGPDGLTVVWH